MKKRFMLFGLILLILAGSAVLRLMVVDADYAEIIAANWDVTLPTEAGYKVVYQKDSGTSFHGDGIRYHVFSCANNEPIDGLFPWPTSRVPRYYGSPQEGCEAWLDQIDIPAAHRPNYSACTVWYLAQSDHSEVLFFWEREAGLLYVAESFM